MFLFNGGQLSEVQIAQIKLQEDEITAYRFFSPDQLPEEITPSRRRRILAGLAQFKTGGAVYLDN
jgi:hypothetical protein